MTLCWPGVEFGKAPCVLKLPFASSVALAQPEPSSWKKTLPQAELQLTWTEITPGVAAGNELELIEAVVVVAVAPDGTMVKLTVFEVDAAYCELPR